MKTCFIAMALGALISEGVSDFYKGEHISGFYFITISIIAFIQLLRLPCKDQ